MLVFGEYTFNGNLIAKGTQKIGETADETDFPLAQLIASQADSTLSDARPIGIVGEAVADDGIGAGHGVFGAALTSNLSAGIGVKGIAKASDTADTADAIGVQGVAISPHTGGRNIGVYAQATNNTGIALLIRSGNVQNDFASDWNLPDDAEALEFNASGHAGLLVFDTTAGNEQVRIGNAAASADFPLARLIASQADSTLSDARLVGIVGEAVADDGIGIGHGVFGAALTSNLSAGIGVKGIAKASNTADTADAIGVQGVAISPHTGGRNIGVYAQATNNTGIALLIRAGNIQNDFASDWDLPTNSEALSFDSSAQAGMLVFDTTAGAEQLRSSVGMLFDGHLSFGALTPTVLSADVDDYEPATGSSRRRIWRLEASGADRTVTGVALQSAGDTLIVVNIGSTNNVVLAHQNASSTASNRIVSPTGADLILGPDEYAYLWHDATTDRWRVLNTNGA